MHGTNFHAITGCAFQWEAQVTRDGSPVNLVELPQPLEGLTKQANYLGAIASGCQSNPGVEIIRLDPKDHPFIYNIDHYRVIERLPDHPDYQKLLHHARVDDSEELRRILDSWIFLLGPEKTSDHWREKLPELWATLLRHNLPTLGHIPS